jgi:choline dehydrogenase-like flavoprotein
MSVPSKSRIVIIGGGIIGCSIAYHLAKRGERDVVVLERLQLTHGATWHAAGLVGQLRSSSNLTRLMRYGAELYGKLEAETGQATGWQRVGSVRLASSPARWLELKRSATMAKGFGFHVELVSAKEAQQLFPLLDIHGRRRRGMDRRRRIRRSREPDDGVRGWRASRRRDDRSGRSRHRPRAARPARDDGGHERGEHRSRMRDQRHRHVGPRDRRHGRHARSRCAPSSINTSSPKGPIAFPPDCRRCATPMPTST